MLPPAAALIAVAALLAACQSRESRVEGALARAGLSPALAACLAPRFARDLTDDQLRALGRATRPDGGGGAGLRGIVARIAATDDPRIVEVVSSAGLACALAG